MNRSLFIALFATALLVMGLGVSPVAAATSPISYLSISLVEPGTHRLVPLKIFCDGQLRLNRTARIPRGATFHVKIVAPRGRYVETVFRDDFDTQFNLPSRARRVGSGAKSFTWTMPTRFVGGSVEVFVALFATVNEETCKLEEPLDRTGWITLGQTSL
ncbi:MAG: hypothetical protein EB084_03085 [Proteobacteria bacterium]|nr:hypothetical protein [Pseudomonadota bacterium]